MAWNVLVYIAADNQLATQIEGTLAKLGAVQAQDGVQIFIQATVGNGASAPDTTRYSAGDGTLKTIEVLSSADPVNTSSAAALTTFLQWGTGAGAPGARTALVMVSHGDGVGTASGDVETPKKKIKHPTLPSAMGVIANPWGVHPAQVPSSGEPILDPHHLFIPDHGDKGEIAFSQFFGKALTIPDLADGIGGIAGGAPNGLDVLVFDACTMAQVELVYELRSVATYIVASEETVPTAGFPYDTWLSAVSSATAPKDFATGAVDSFAQLYEGTSLDINMAVLGGGGAVDAPIAALAKNIGALGALLMPHVGDDGLKKAQHDALGFDPPYFIDLGQLVARLGLLEPTIPGAAAASLAVATAMNDVVVYARPQPRVATLPDGTIGPTGPTGLAIVFPASGQLISSYAALQFNQNPWHAFLLKFLAR